MNTSFSLKAYLLGTVCALAAPVAMAQDADAPEDQIIVVGTQIKGSDIGGTLPVTVLDAAEIENTGAVDGEELLRSVPQLGAVNFTGSNVTGVNGARGDIGSINLRALGTGNTLVLLNGRRLVNHPGTQAENLVPVVTVNSNALPVTGIERLEILRDGASAIYGTDAVAGVINTILEDDYEGFRGELRYGASEGTDLNELIGTFKAGFRFNDDRTSLSFFANFLDREGMPASDREYSATEDLRPFFEGTSFEGDTQLRNLSTQTQFGEFRSLSGTIAAIGDDDFHIQPDTLPGGLVALPNGVCADNGGSIDTALRLDRAGFRQLVGDTERQNFLAFLNHEFDNGNEFFGEFSYYHADYSRQREMAQILSSNRIVVPSTAFHNPFGVDLEIRDYRPLDAGPRQINVENNSYRILGGFRGQSGNWDWETAALWSEAETEDVTNRVSNTLFQQAIARTDASAYNPFAGGNITDTNLPNLTANAQTTIDSFIVDVSRTGTTNLGLLDLKFSNPAVWALPAGDVGIAVGGEYRYQQFQDDRDDRLDGTITFTDVVTGVTNLSDVMGSSPTPDTNGDRDVHSAYAELAVPLVSEEMNWPLVHSLDMQLAVRGERYSDVGSIAKPKVAFSWYPVPSFQVRAAYSEGFRAPNLEQINAEGIRRVNTGREDWILCEATSRANATAFNSGDCDSVSVESVRAGGTDLEPEENENLALGFVYEPEWLNNLTFTLDWWRVEQVDIVGIFGDQNQISLDYLLRTQGSSNPNVVRAAPDAATAALFTAAGLDPSGAGEIIEVRDNYTNLTPRSVEGIDIGVFYDWDMDELGDFRVSFNAAYLEEFFQDPSPDAAALQAAVDAGTISEEVEVLGAEDLVQQNGRPEWRTTASLRWRKDNWGAGAFYRYVGEFVDTSTVNAEGEPLPIDAWQTLSLYGDYTFRSDNDRDLRLRVGVRNVTDEDPPIADEFGTGYFESQHSNRGRYWYVSVRKDF